MVVSAAEFFCLEQEPGRGGERSSRRACALALHLGLAVVDRHGQRVKLSAINDDLKAAGVTAGAD